MTLHTSIWFNKDNEPESISIYKKGDTHHEYLSKEGEFKKTAPLSCGNFRIEEEFLLDVGQLVHTPPDFGSMGLGK